MLQPSTLRFLRDLGKNNNRDWFEQNRPRFDTAKANFDGFITKLLKELTKVDPTLGGLEAKDCVFRIYRDVRFSKNKTPYKVNFSASIKSGGRKSTKCGLYLQVEPKGEWGSFLAGGFWMPEAPILKMIRQEVEYNTDEFKKIIGNKTFKKWYNELEEQKLKKAPKGVDPDHPDIELLKYTSFIATHELNDKEILSADFIKICVNGYKVMKPLLDFLNRAIDK